MNAFSARAQPVRQRFGAWVPVLALAAAALALELGGDMARLALRYDRAELEGGELWRLLTAHVVHLGWLHSAMIVAALVVIRVLIADSFSALEWIAASAVAALGIDAGLYWLSPQIDWYVGLSGVLHGLLAAGAIVLLRDTPALGVLLGAGLAAKLLLEQTSGPLPLTESTAGGPVIVAAHLYGAADGAAYGTVRSVSRRGRAPV